ncbi:MAG: EAL domain-containing protein [Gloeomargaritaceae cyanobacterium C42_A2020_066]|nr:EAL domain-containing protein [Gloeomargaritaceae cyanobacterium C42_A2020_066]
MTPRLETWIEPVETASPQGTVRQAVATMGAQRTPCVVVLDEGRPAGILTKRDVVRLAATDPDFLDRPLGAVMVQPLITLNGETLTDIFVPLALFREHRIRQLPVVDAAGRLLGLMTQEGLRRQIQPSDLLRLRRLSEVMTRPVVAAGEDTPVAGLIQRMAQERISCVVLVAEAHSPLGPTAGRPVGILTEGDVVSLLAAGRDIHRTEAKAVMGTPLHILRPQSTLWDAQQLMAQQGVKRVVVTSRRGELLGIVTQTDVLQALDPLDLQTTIHILNQALDQEIKTRQQLETQLSQPQSAALAALAQKSAELEALVAALPIGVLAVDQTGKLIYVNPAFVQMLGWRAEELLGVRPPFPFWPPDQHEALMQVFAAGMTQANHQVDVQFQHRDGHRLDIRVTDACLLDTQGNRLGMIGTFQDITSLKGAIAAQSRQERRFRALIENAADLLLLLDPQGLCTYVSPAAKATLGYDPACLVGRPYFEVIHPDDRSAVAHTLGMAASDPGRPITLPEHRLRTAAGQWLVFEAKVTHQTRDPDVGAIVVNCRDISVRKTAEAELLASEHRFRTLVANIPGAVYRMQATPPWMMVFVSGPIEAVSGYSAQALLNERAPSWDSLIHPDDRDWVIADTLAATHERKIYALEYRVVRADGRIGWVSEQGQGVFAPDGTCLYLDGVLFDITDRQTAFQALRNSEARLQLAMESAGLSVWELDWPSQMVTVISHLPRSRYRTRPPGTSFQVSLEDFIRPVHPDDRPALDALLMQTAQDVNQAYYEWEGRVVMEDGSLRWQQVLGKVQRDAQGVVLGSVGITRDITESKLAELTRLRQQRWNEAWASIVLKIRESLELEAILQTTVDEVQSLFQCDRVLVYRFLPNWSGEFIVEAIGPQGAPILTRTLEDPCFTEQCISLYRHGRVSVLGDVLAANLQPCYLDMLRQFDIRANLVVPILAGPELWGLLLAQHCQGPRPWIPEEVDVLQQIAGQVGLAVTQAELVASLRQEKQRFRMVVEDQTELIYRCRSNGTLTFVNQAFARYAGRPVDALLDEVFQHPFLPEDQTRFGQHLTELTPGTPVGTLECQTTAGRWYEWTVRAVFNEKQQPLEYQAIGRDISERKRAEAQLLHEALHDALTSLPNRVLFMDRLTQAMSRFRRFPERPFAVLFLDLDRFKVINDSLGHRAGDDLLVILAQRLTSVLRETDTIARLGGDEFVLILEDLESPTLLNSLLERLQTTLSTPVQLSGHTVTPACSIGVVLSHSDYQTAEEMLRDADIAMYQAKGSGRNRYVLFTPQMHVEALAAMQLENDLRRAIDRHELCVYYQPIVALGQERVVGFEALVRWQHPERGLVSPGEFIPLAEETGLIVPLGWWVLEAAADQVARWQRQWVSQSLLTVSVNLSAQQLTQPDLVDRIQMILATSGLPPQSLRLEITEHTMMTNIEQVGQALERLRQLQVQLNVDDFGTGYSSLALLHNLPIDALKIDRSFTRRLNTDGGTKEIVRSILTLGESLGLDVVAEGVETAEQLAELQALGCPYGQGYLFCRPLPPDQVWDHLATTRFLEHPTPRDSTVN